MKPTGVNNRSNAYYKRVNHAKIPREYESRGLFYGSGFTIAVSGLVSNPYFGVVPQIGATLTVLIEDETDGMIENPVITWLTAESGEIETGSSLLLDVANDGEYLDILVESDNYEPQTLSLGLIRQPPPVNIDPPEIQIVNDLPPDFLAGFGEQLERTEGTWTAPGATVINGYAYFDGEDYTDISGTSDTIYTIGENDSGQQLVGSNRRVSSGGDVTVYSSPISAETFTEAASTGNPTISAPDGFDVGQIITMTSGGVTGNPSPTIELQLLANGSPVSGKVINGPAGNVTIPDLEGQTLSVRETITSPMNDDPIVVTSIGYGPVTAPEVAELDNMSVGTQTEDGLPVFYTVTGETSVKFFAVETGALDFDDLPVGIAADIADETLAEALTYCDAVLTPLDDGTSLGTFSTVGFIDEVDLGVLVSGGGDSDVYLVGEGFTLNLLTAPIITPISGGLNFLNPLLKAPVITPIEGGLNFGD